MKGADDCSLVLDHGEKVHGLRLHVTRQRELNRYAERLFGRTKKHGPRHCGGRGTLVLLLGLISLVPAGLIPQQSAAASPFQGPGTRPAQLRPAPNLWHAAGTGLESPLLPGPPMGPAIPLPPAIRDNSKLKAPPPLAENGNLAAGQGKYAGMVLIPAGTFEMGSAAGAGRPDERPIHRVYVKDFYIAKHEVTATEYCRFLNSQGAAGKDGTPRLNPAGPECPVVKTGKTFEPKKGMADRPMVYVSWYGAADYAEWAGARLPTSAEWEKAATLTTPNRPGDYLTILTRDGSVPVSIAFPGAGGLTGMIGNVWEWCADWYARDYYQRSPSDNPVGPALGEEKVIRGGSWASAESSKRIQNIHRASPAGYFRSVGFRIVKD